MNEAAQEKTPRTENKPIPVLQEQEREPRGKIPRRKKTKNKQVEDSTESYQPPMRKMTSTEKASRTAGSSTVSDGEGG